MQEWLGCCSGLQSVPLSGLSSDCQSVLDLDPQTVNEWALPMELALAIEMVPEWDE